MTQRWKAGSDKKANANVKSKVGERKGQVGEIVTKKNRRGQDKVKENGPKVAAGHQRRRRRRKREEKRRAGYFALSSRPNAARTYRRKTQRAVHRSRHKSRKTAGEQTKVRPTTKTAAITSHYSPSNKVICSASRRRECGWNDPSLLCQPDHRQAITAAPLIRVTDKLA